MNSGIEINNNICCEDCRDEKSLYIKAFYWTITTLTTIGYGDITPTGNVLILYVILIELLGAGMY
ncbi:unnamed protein product, partial [marine sediment metagenome]